MDHSHNERRNPPHLPTDRIVVKSIKFNVLIESKLL